MSKDEFFYKILILGDMSVGKTSFLTRYVDNTFDNFTLNTIGVDYVLKNVQMEDGSIVKLQIWDTAGQERFNSISKTYYRGAHAIVLLFSVVDKKSFGNAQKWLSQIKEEVNEKVPIILVGNKIDLVDEREIPDYEGKELADEFNINYFECSAKSGENINLAFEDLIKKMVKTVDKSKDNNTKIIIQNKKNKKSNSCCKK